MRAFVIHWNRPTACAATIERLLGELTPETVSVVDNASSGRALSDLRDLLSGSGVSILSLQSNVGYAGAIALVLRREGHSGFQGNILILAHDAIVAPGSVGLLEAALEETDDLGLAFARVGQLERGCWRPILGPSTRLILDAESQRARLVFGDYFTGPLIGISRRFLSRGCSIDSRLFCYLEECDMALAAARAGLRVGLVTQARVENSEVGISGGGRGLVAYLQARNSILLTRRYATSASAVARFAVIVLSVLRNSILGRGRREAMLSTARVRGAIDGLAGRFGEPPKRFFGSRSPES